MSARRYVLPLLLVLLVLIFGSVAEAQSPTSESQEIFKKLYCPICAGIRLDVCEQKVCEDMRDLIETKLAAGESEDQIIQYFVERYGEQVLGFPPPKGFNLLAWLLPLGVLVGASVWAAYALRDWTRRRGQVQAKASSEEISSEYIERLEKELAEFE